VNEEVAKLWNFLLAIVHGHKALRFGRAEVCGFESYDSFTPVEDIPSYCDYLKGDHSRLTSVPLEWKCANKELFSYTSDFINQSVFKRFIKPVDFDAATLELTLWKQASTGSGDGKVEMPVTIQGYAIKNDLYFQFEDRD
jgi:hypothetical protein